MDEGLPSGSLWAAIGSAITAAIYGGLYVRRKLSSDSTGIAGDRAEKALLEFLSKELEKANERIAEERQRADKFAAERNELNVLVGRLQGEIHALSQRVEDLTEEVRKSRIQGSKHEEETEIAQSTVVG